MMISPINSSVSAINAALKKRAASSHNIANVNTDGFKSVVASLQENRNGGVSVKISKNPQPGAVYDKGNGEETESSNVDLAVESVQQIIARNMFAANIAALKTYQEMEESVIDIMA